MTGRQTHHRSRSVATTRKRLQGRLQVWRITTANVQRMIVALILAAIGLLIGGIDGSGWVLWFAFGVLGTSILLPIIDYRSSNRRALKLAITPATVGEVSVEPFETFERGGFVTCFSDALDAEISRRDWALAITDTRYPTPPLLPEVRLAIFNRRRHSGALLFNDVKVRQETDLEPEAPSVQICRTGYFDGLMTNEMFGRRVSINRVTLYQPAELTVTHEPGSTSPTLLPLSQSSMSNHIGVSTLAVCADSMMVLTAQGHRSAQEPGEYVASGSGSLDWSDVKAIGDQRGFLELVAHGMERELREEAAVPKHADPHTQVIGYSRHLHRGGKPEYLGLSRLSCSSHELTVSKHERGLTAEHRFVPVSTISRAGLISSLQSLTTDTTLSNGLVFQLHCAIRHLEQLRACVVGRIAPVAPRSPNRPTAPRVMPNQQRIDGRSQGAECPCAATPKDERLCHR